METSILTPIGFAILFIAAVYQLFALVRNYKFIIRSNINTVESNKFAFNSAHNNARSSGLSHNGKLTHHKISHGGADYSGDTLDGKLDNNSIVLKFDVKERDSYIFVPQVKLHGAGWFA